jgi:cold-inducible RNA-binding protein
MGKKLYVGNLPFAVDDAALNGEFSKVGTVTSARVITDRETGRSRGYGFVEMESDEMATAAIEQLNGQSLGGRNISVSEARPQTDRPGGGGGRGGGGRGGGGRGFGGGGGGDRSSRGPRY